MTVNFDVIPAELKSRDQWVCWGYRGDEKRKMPLQGDKGWAASVSDPDTHCSFDTCVEGCVDNPDRCDGIGFVFTADDAFLGIDLDNAFELSGGLRPWAAEVVSRFEGAGYVERSPSGTGLKIITRGKFPDGHRHQCSFGDKQAIEVYDNGRYFTVTGQVYGGTEHLHVQDGSAAIEWLCERHLALREEVVYTSTLPSPPGGNGVSAIDRARDYAAKFESVAEGGDGRNNAAFRNAANLKDFGLTEDEAFGLMIEWNEKNEPPMSQHELRRTVNSAMRNARSPRLKERPMEAPRQPRPMQFTGGTLNGAPAMVDVQELHANTEQVRKEVLGDADKLGEPIDLWAAAANPRPMKEVLVEGMLRRGEIMNLVGASKARKSWMAAHLAFAVATSTQWLGRLSKGGNVLVIDNELHGETVENRYAAVGRGLGLLPGSEKHTFGSRIPIADRFEMSCHVCRGRDVTVRDIDALLKTKPKGHYKLIVIDAKYRMSDGEENSNTDQTRFYNQIDRIATEHDCAIVLVHHSSKGTQGDKAAIDVGSGAGAQVRATDTHIVFRDHEDESYQVVDAIVRSFPLTDAERQFTIEWSDRLHVWQIARHVEPELKSRASAAVRKDRDNVDEMAERILDALEEGPEGELSESKIATKCRTKAGRRVFRDAISMLAGRGEIRRLDDFKSGSKTTVGWAKMP